LDLGGAGHQAISDIALYAELAAHLPDLPDIVRQYLASTSADAGAPGVMTWRELMRVQVTAAWAFLDVVLDLDAERGHTAVAELESVQGVRLQRR
jgi:hypothetical protein